MLPELTISSLLGTMMIMLGDIFILLGLLSAALALLFAILGKLSPKIKQQKEDLRLGAGAVFLLVMLAAMFIGKLLTEDLSGINSGAFFKLSDALFVFLWLGMVFMLVVTAVVSFSGGKNS
jgi:hypothetical protein